MAIIIPGSGDSAELLVGNRVKMQNGNLIVPETNYLSKWQDASRSPGALSTVAAGGNIATTANLFYSTSTGTSFTLTNPSSTALRGGMNFLSATNTADNVDGTVFFQFPATALEAMDLGKPVSISLDVTGLTSAGWDVVVVRYDSAGVFQGLIPVAGNASTSTSTPSALLPTGTSQFRGFFVASSTSGDLYALRFRRITGSEQVRLDTLYVGPQTQLSGAAVTDWQSYTPADVDLNGFTTIANKAFEWRRTGDTINVRGSFSASGAAAEARFPLPTGLTIGTLPASIQLSGQATIGGNAETDWYLLASSGQAYFRIGIAAAGSSGITPVNGNELIGTSSIYFEASAKISGWSSNVTMAERAVEEYASNSATSDADDTTSFVNGIDGSVVPVTLAQTRTKRVRFQSPIQATDRIVIEVQDSAAARWVSVGEVNSFHNGYPVSQYGFTTGGSATASVGLSVNGVSGSTTDLDVVFGRYYYASLDGATTQDWGAANTAGRRWRVRKVSGGAAIGYPVGARNVVGDVTGTAVPTGMIGERLTAVNTTASNAVSNTPYSSGTVSLTPGNYDLYGMVAITDFGTLSGVAGGIIAVRDATATSFTGTVLADNRLTIAPNDATEVSGMVGPFRVNITATTTYHAVGQINATSGTGTANLRIIANRVG